MGTVAFNGLSSTDTLRFWISNSLKYIALLIKCSISDIWQASEYALISA